MINQRSQQQRGFTLMELIIGLSLTVLLLSAIAPLLTVSVQSWRIGSSRSEVQQTARFAVESITRDLHYGTNFARINGFEISFTDAGNSEVHYRLDTTTHILYKVTGTTQPVTGTNVRNSTNVEIYGDYGGNQELFNFPAAAVGKTPDDRPIEIYLRAIDTVTGETVRLHTSVQSISRYLR